MIEAAILGGGALAAAGNIFSGIFGAAGAKQQAAAIQYAADKAAETALTMNQRAREDVAPFRQYGITAGDTLMGMLTGGKDVSDTLQESDLYQFQSTLGMRDINRQLAARGMSNSGAGLETLQRFTNQLVAEEGQRFYDRLFGVTQLGANSAAQMGSMTNQTGQNVAQIQSQMGLAKAGAIGQEYQAYGNMVGGTLSGFGNTLAQYPMYQASIGMLNQMGTQPMGGTPSNFMVNTPGVGGLTSFSLTGTR